MDARELRELIELISRSSFTTFELERNDFRLRLVKGAPAPAGVSLPAERAQHGPEETAPAAEPALSQASTAAPASEPAAAEDAVELNSPIVGTFYASPSPDAARFVEVGAHVSRGQVLCIVEAMKVMNEIESEIDGEILEAPVENGQPVEYGEVLFRLRPA